MYTGFIFNYIFAWLAVFIGIFLLSKYLLRKAAQRLKGQKSYNLAGINKSWKYPHIFLGFTLIAVGLIHGLYSSVKVWSLNLGTLTWLVTILFGFTWIFKKNLKAKWLELHRILAMVFMAAVVWHVIDAGGVNVFRILSEINDKTTYEAVIYDNSINQKPEIQKPEIEQDTASAENNNNLDAVIEEKKLPYYFSFEGLELADGTYTAEDTGYSPGLKVEVDIENNMVRKIKILSHHEVDSKYYKDAMTVIPAAILSRQTLDVDAISGSSMTSVGIIKAVRKAVLEAKESAEAQTQNELRKNNK